MSQKGRNLKSLLKLHQKKKVPRKSKKKPKRLKVLKVAHVKKNLKEERDVRNFLEQAIKIEDNEKYVDATR